MNFRSKSNRKAFAIIFVSIAVIVITVVFCIADYAYVETTQVVVERTFFQQSVSGDSDGNVRVGTTWNVYTDRGLYQVTQTGLRAHPELIGQIKCGDTLTVTSRGYMIPMLGNYPVIVAIEK